MLPCNDAIKTAAPGKIILSGEHAVVYGCPALAMAINDFCYVTLQVAANLPFCLTLNLSDYAWQQSFSKQNLLYLQKQTEERYQNFLQGKISNNKILLAAELLAIYTVIFFRQRFAIDTNTCLNVTVTSSIPTSCGLGSSAALIVAIGRAIQQCSQQLISPEVFLTWSREVENLQHGCSSGIDLYLAYHGGMVFFADHSGVVYSRNTDFHDTPLALRLVNTGPSESTTAECVVHTKQFFKHSAICDRFTQVTTAMYKGFEDSDYPAIKECVRENHNLLNYVGVVPAKVAAFVSEIEQRGLAAKISGSGAVYGDSAGVVLVFGDGDIDDVVAKYGWSVKCLIQEV